MIIKTYRRIIKQESVTLADCINLTNLLVQKIDGYRVESGYLFIQYGNRTSKFKIDLHPELVAITLNPSNTLGFGNGKNKQISLTDLKNTPIVNYKERDEMMDYCDNLFFSQYLDVKVSTNELTHPELLSIKCAKNKYYNLIKNTKRFKT